LILPVNVYREVGDIEAVLEEFRRVLKPEGNLVIVEVIKKVVFSGAPVQNPGVLKDGNR